MTRKTKGRIAPALLAAAGMIGATVAQAAGESATRGSPPAAGTGVAQGPSSAQQITGSVKSISRANGTLTLTLAGSGERLRVDALTQLTRNGVAASWSELKEGDLVRAVFTRSGGATQVESVQALGPAAPAPSYSETGQYSP